MAERTAEDIALGILRIPVGGTVKAVPTLKADHIEEWARLFDTLTGGYTELPDEWVSNGITAVAALTIGAHLDLLTAYDRTSALGGREWLAANADPAQLRSALVQMADNAFFGGEATLGQAMSAMLRRVVDRLAPQSSTNGASSTGISTRKRSARATTRSS